MCVHKDLVCDGHPQCLNNEDEDFDTCKTKWIEKKVFPRHATVRCKSKAYPSLEIIAGPCDGIVECRNSIDESSCSDDSTTIIVAVVVIGVIILYFTLKYSHQISNSKVRNKINKKEGHRGEESRKNLFEEFIHSGSQ